MRILPHGLISKIMKETGLRRDVVSCVLTSSNTRRRKPEVADITKISEALNKLGYNVSADDLSVGWGISSAPLHKKWREDYYLITEKVVIDNLFGGSQSI
jgi:hypothetical protein